MKCLDKVCRLNLLYVVLTTTWCCDTRYVLTWRSHAVATLTLNHMMLQHSLYVVLTTTWSCNMHRWMYHVLRWVRMVMLGLFVTIHAYMYTESELVHKWGCTHREIVLFQTYVWLLLTDTFGWEGAGICVDSADLITVVPLLMDHLWGQVKGDHWQGGI
jgi:hypothetical protein